MADISMDADDLRVDGEFNAAGSQASAEMAGAAVPAIDPQAKGARKHGGQPSRFGLFLRSSLPDFVMVLLASVALVYTVSYAFESAPELRSSLAVCFGLVAPLLVMVFAGSWSKRAVVPAAIGAIAYSAAVLAFMAGMVPEGVELVVDGQVNDVAENYVVFGLVALVVPTVVFLLSRRRVGVVLLLVACVIACGLVQFLYRDWSRAHPGTIAALVALFAVGMMFVYQGYRSSVYKAKSVTRTSFGGAAAFSMLISLACVVAGCFVFYGVIDPLGLSTPEIKPFQELYSRPVVEFSSPYAKQRVENPDLTTDQLNADQLDTSDNIEGGEAGSVAEGQPESGESSESADWADWSDWSGSPVEALIENTQAFDPDSWNEAFQTINYQRLATGLFLSALFVVAAVVAAVLAWRSQRGRRLARLNGRARAYGVWYLYTFITRRLERLGFIRPDTFTPLEFAIASRNALAPFTRGTDGVDYLQLTLIYQRACYAPETLTASDEADMVRYYQRFFDNARRFVGLRRWLVKFWRI